ncbi:MAG: hypothetical protein A2X77_06310 [Gammaproteobacteria bacterium GWE2_42_36]|nr:MAG: hypothetical protein A2X77_06310 [Gammaproteobacteria bacterium GWE2_42_36]HCU05359.1 hypothetical protein [Coxiellaceae bacterium]
MQMNKQEQNLWIRLVTLCQQFEQLSETPQPKENFNQVLTSREIECLSFVARGLTSKAIAKQLTISARTVETHLNNVRKKLHCYSKTQLAEIYWRVQSGKNS